MEISAKLVSYQDVFECVHMCILSQTVLIMHNTAWAVLMFKTVAKREEKKIPLIYSFVSESSNKNKLPRKIRIEWGGQKYRTAGQERSVVCVCALNTKHRPQ